MKLNNKYTRFILTVVAFGVLGSIFTTLVLESEDYFLQAEVDEYEFIVDSIRRSIGLGGLLIGLSLSAILGNLFFIKFSNLFWIKWFFILLSSSVLAILTHNVVLIYFFPNAPNQLGLGWVVKLFVILTPFVFLFAGSILTVKKFQNYAKLEKLK